MYCGWIYSWLVADNWFCFAVFSIVENCAQSWRLCASVFSCYEIVGCLCILVDVYMLLLQPVTTERACRMVTMNINQMGWFLDPGAGVRQKQCDVLFFYWDFRLHLQWFVQGWVEYCALLFISLTEPYDSLFFVKIARLSFSQFKNSKPMSCMRL